MPYRHLMPNSDAQFRASIFIEDRRDVGSVEFAATFFDGARGTRTPDLLGAIQALSQLSYSPVRRRVAARMRDSLALGG
jgi:hypothetical protein